MENNMNQEYIKIILGSFTVGYLSASFNILSFTLGCGLTYSLCKIASPFEIHTYIKYIKNIYEDSSKKVQNIVIEEFKNT